MIAETATMRNILTEQRRASLVDAEEAESTAGNNIINNVE
jgi:hypothetical protein